MVYKKVPKKKKICKICEKEFQTNTDIQIYCSIECRKIGDKNNYTYTIRPCEKEKRKCKNCGEYFIWKSNRPMKKYCSKQCVKEHQKKVYNLINNKTTYVKYCIICNNEFTTTRKNKITCSKQCTLKKDSLYNKKLQEGLIETNGKMSGYYRLRFAIFNRDKFTCQYCGKNVKDDGIKLQADHIIPKSKGGEFVMNNMITSCSECNLGKSDVLLEERLIKRFKENIF